MNELSLEGMQASRQQRAPAASSAGESRALRMRRAQHATNCWRAERGGREGALLLAGGRLTASPFPPPPAERSLARSQVHLSFQIKCRIATATTTGDSRTQAQGGTNPLG